MPGAPGPSETHSQGCLQQALSKSHFPKIVSGKTLGACQPTISRQRSELPAATCPLSHLHTKPWKYPGNQAEPNTVSRRPRHVAPSESFQGHNLNVMSPRRAEDSWAPSHSGSLRMPPIMATAPRWAGVPHVLPLCPSHTQDLPSPSVHDRCLT